MPTYIVTTEHLYTERVRIEAENEEDALEAVYQGDGETIEGSLNYSEFNPLDNASEWDIEEE